MKKDFENKKGGIAVISGGTGYLGRHLSNLLIQNGFVVFSLGKKNINPSHTHAVKLDITDEKAVERFVLAIKEKYGHIDVIVHAVAVPLIRKPILSITQDEFKSQLEVTVTGAFNLFKHFKPIINQNGSIIGVTSGVINHDSQYNPTGSYMTAKYALKGMLRGLYNELKGGIRVYAVSPTFMPGGLNSDIPKKALNFIKQKSKPGEITNPDDVALNILSLINDTTGRMNGKLINVPSGIITDL
jgi:NAD(P)-dependent dehydrogenase (short-subunit alcohol dehydrogenase family)